MNAARAAGARGGTVLHGKGTGSKGRTEVLQHLHRGGKGSHAHRRAAEQKAAIMQAILKKAGPGTKASALVFSLPTTEVAGFGLFEDA